MVSIPYSRKPCALLNVVMAFAMLFIGISLLVVGGSFQSDKFFQSEGELRQYSDSLFLGCIIMAGITILGSICGCASGYIPNKCFAVMLGALITPIWITFLIMSITAGGIMASSEDGLQSFCNGEPQDRGFTQMFDEYVNDIDMAIIPAINKWMCSRQCPCPSTEQTPWRNGYPQSSIVKLGRTWSTTDSNDADGTVQMFFPSVDSTTNDY